MKWTVYILVCATATVVDSYFRAWWVFVLLGLYILGMVSWVQRITRP